MNHWIKQVLIALDQLANAFLKGWADETLSSRAHREKRVNTERFINLLFWREPDHCRKAYLSERERLQLPPEFRTPQRSTQ